MGTSIVSLSSVTIDWLDLAKHRFSSPSREMASAAGCPCAPQRSRRNKPLEFFASLPPCLTRLEASGSAHHWRAS